ncbi:DUF1850 domain-containing protein [Pseudomonas sp. CDFA 553]|uniref:DUF1850 domain-containing protein n=1 Tax=Pseudomonas quasicaspiana TaxID=2829821 RepID=UPI001E570B0F|nr:DUF1850 domain-containing protein [Pseudomonas quasicaspiana]MCD5986314.1 DUF1850 domain-containing protein [Pseudomonas quasicaspiana]
MRATPRFTLLAGTATLAVATTVAQAASVFINVPTSATSVVYYPIGVALSHIYGEAIPSVESWLLPSVIRLPTQGLLLGEARVRGAGAGMEIPPDAQLQNGSWHYQRQLSPLQPLKLARTPEAGDFQLCFDGTCHLMSEWVGLPSSSDASIELWSCT